MTHAAAHARRPRVVLSAPAEVPADVVAAVSAFLAPEVTIGIDPALPKDTTGRAEMVEVRSTIARTEWPRGTVAIVPGPARTRFLTQVGGWTDRRRRVAVVSTDGFDLASANDRARLAKIVAHEAGHVLGLRHCRLPACLAAFAPEPSALDRLTGFCPRCRRRLSRARGFTR
jgi:hypothetical protein